MQTGAFVACSTASRPDDREGANRNTSHHLICTAYPAEVFYESLSDLRDC